MEKTKLTESLKNIEKDLNLVYYRFDSINNEYITNIDFGSITTKEYVSITIFLLENNISFETTEKSSIKILK